MPKYVKKLTNDELLERMADDLVQVHLDGGIDLAYWETALEIVERFYFVRASVEVGEKKNSEGLF
jgi:hypothetical protein